MLLDVPLRPVKSQTTCCRRASPPMSELRFCSATSSQAMACLASIASPMPSVRWSMYCVTAASSPLIFGGSSSMSRVSVSHACRASASPPWRSSQLVFNSSTSALMLTTTRSLGADGRVTPYSAAIACTAASSRMSSFSTHRRRSSRPISGSPCEPRSRNMFEQERVPVLLDTKLKY